uniref:Uncharacterized protein n=1 Tax=Clastoptera arizonana TaxID=38151 RepID=A0A1B6CEY1_9HEMI
MSAPITSFLTIASVVFTLEGCGRNLVQSYTREYTCIGQNFQLTTYPRRFIVNHENCDTKYPFDMIMDWQTKPSLVYTAAKAEEYYTIVMLKPVKYYETLEFDIHWMEMNVRGYDLAENKWQEASTVSEYLGPTLMFNKFGTEVFQFLIYQQERPQFTTESYCTPRNRIRFNLLEYFKRQPIQFEGPIVGLQIRIDYNREVDKIN